MGRFSYEYNNLKVWLKSVSIFFAVRKQEAEDRKNPNLAISRRIKEEDEDQDLKVSQTEVVKYKVSSYRDQNGYILAIFLGIIFLTYGGTYVIKTEIAKAWPSITGKVIESGVNASYGRGRYGRGYSYVANIEYLYVINGQQYISNMISFGEYGLKQFDYAQLLNKKYPLNQKVNVHYNPQNPGESILEFNEASLYFYTTVGLLCLLGGLIAKRKYDAGK